MMNDDNIKKYNLDFIQNKENIIAHYEGIDRYSEWDFTAEGSALNLMMDLLAYNTSQNAFVANRFSAEMLLGTTQKREMAVSAGNTLGGYLPSSSIASRAELTVKILSFNGTTPEFVVLPTGSKFFTEAGFDFFTAVDYIAYPDSEGFAVFENVIVYEGRRIEIEAPLYDNGFVISSPRVDLSTLNVYVDDVASQQMNVDIDIAEVDENTNVFSIRENYDGRYEVTFGDGVFGKMYSQSNELRADYIVAQNLAEANGLSDFTSNPIQGYADIEVSAVKKSYGGSERETIETIKKYAPLHFSAANRAVTPADYKYLIEKNFPFVKSVAVWGGEETRDNDFGNVFFAAIDQNDEDITVDQQDAIIQFLRSKNVGPIKTIFTPVNVIDIYPVVEMIVNPKQAGYSADVSKIQAQGAIDSYGVTISGFDREYSTMDLSNSIEAVVTGLKNITVDVRLNKEIVFSDNDLVETELEFNVPLYHPFDGYSKDDDGVILSTSISDPITGLEYFLNDDGYGNIRRYYVQEDGVKVYVNEKQGSIEYSTGFIRITPFNGYGNSNFSLRAQPASGIIKATQETNFRLSSKNSVVVIKTDV